MTARSPDIRLALAEEADVVALAQAGERLAFTELVNRRHSGIRNLLRRVARDASLADDLAQETFLLAWRQLPGLRGSGAFGAWLRQIAVSVWLQHVRRNKLFAPLPAEVADRCDDALTGVGFDLDAALAHLAPDARLCVVLAYHEGMSHGEIVAATGLPLGTVKSHIQRGAAQLRDRLQDYQRS